MLGTSLDAAEPWINRDRAATTLPVRAGLRTNRNRRRGPQNPRTIRNFDQKPQTPKAEESNACSGTSDKPLSCSRKSGPQTGARIWCKRIQISACSFSVSYQVEYTRSGGFSQMCRIERYKGSERPWKHRANTIPSKI